MGQFVKTGKKASVSGYDWRNAGNDREGILYVRNRSRIATTEHSGNAAVARMKVQQLVPCAGMS